VESSTQVGEAELGAVLTATERRVTSTGTVRYHVQHGEHIGWISERINGGHEELIVTRLPAVDTTAVCQLDGGVQQCLAEWRERVQAQCGAAADQWLLCPAAAVIATAVLPAAALAAVREEDAWTEAGFTAAARTAAVASALQQQQQQQQQQLWTVEQDMQLAEALSELADYYGEEPHNVPCAALRAALETPGSSVAAMLAAPGRELLEGIAPRNVLARMAVLRVLNARIGRALPLLCVALPEEVRHYCLSCFACMLMMCTVLI
jgi:hypothetical protein